MLTTAEFVDQFNREYFDSGLCEAVLERLRLLPVDRADARGFVDRLGRLARTANLDARDLSPFQADILASLISRLLPGTWDGRVPPITIPGRHRKIDELVSRVCGPSGRLLDIACGFPPFTSVDTANALPGWDIVGVDRSLPEYLVEDGLGNYAVYDASGAAQYFQPIVPTAESWVALLDDADATKGRLEALLRDLLGVRAQMGTDTPPDRIEHGGATLVVTPAHEYARHNLRFLRSDLDALTNEPADVVRCFNMLMYFDDAFRERALGHFARLLKDGGLAICGVDWAFSMEARYATYRKSGASLVPFEFAFSLDNLVPIGIATWYTLQPDDRDAAMLARLSAVLRSDRAFFHEYTATADAIREDIGLCPRLPDGHFADVNRAIPAAELWGRAAEFPDRLSDRLGSHAVEVLTAAGHKARLNEAGHVAVRI
jgi:hypothetical protein